MKQKKGWGNIILRWSLSALAVGVMWTSAGEFTEAKRKEEKEEKKASVIFTHDIHSHLDVKQSADGSEVGGMAKLKTKIDELTGDKEAYTLVDGGDFSMGTLYQTIYESQASELMMLGTLGYDATTLGNHEFDYRSVGLANMLSSAKRHAKEEGITLPALVQANMDWDKNTSKENQIVKTAMDEFGSTEYIVLERGGVRIGIYGVMGQDAEDCAPESKIDFGDIIETSKRMVKTLEKEEVDLIVCLSHSGTWEEKQRSEDELLAQAVPEIDVIVSGHTHTALDEPLVYGDTYVVSCGCYGTDLGEISLTQKEDGRWKLENYHLYNIDETVANDTYVEEKLAQYKAIVDEEYLSHFGYTFDQVLAENDVDFTTIEEVLEKRGEGRLGNLISDSYLYAVKQVEGEDYIPVDFAVVPSGIVRETMSQGQVTVGDVFEISSLGIGADRIPGYPLVSVYLTGKEIKDCAEVDASVSPLMDGTELFPRGIGWEYNPHRLILNRVTKVWKTTEDGEQEELEDGKLYRVVADMYSAQMLGAVKSSSFGLLSIQPKDEKGQEITDFESRIIYQQKKQIEVKAWVALASFLESFPKTDGVSNVPKSYETLEGRKIISDRMNPVELLKHPNKVAGIVVAVLVVAVLLLIGMVLVIRRFYGILKGKVWQNKKEK